MSDEDFIFELFFRVDEGMREVKKHSQALLYPSEVATLAILFVVKGGTGRAFYRGGGRTGVTCFPSFLNAPGCFGCSRRIGNGRNVSWPILRFLA